MNRFHLKLLVGLLAFFGLVLTFMYAWEPFWFRYYNNKLKSNNVKDKIEVIDYLSRKGRKGNLALNEEFKNHCKTILKFWGAIASENTEQSKARRALAQMTFKVFFSMLLMAIGVYPFEPGYARFILEIAGSISFIISAITVIYFGPHQIQKIFKKEP